MTKRASLAVILLLLVASSARADFDAVVRAVERNSGTPKMKIPFLGLARFAVWVVRPHGVHDFQLATFEHDRRVTPMDMSEILASRAGAGFAPLVRVRSKREQTYIYARPMDDKRIELLVANQEPRETVVIRAVIDAEQLSKHIGDHGGFGRDQRRERHRERRAASVSH